MVKNMKGIKEIVRPTITNDHKRNDNPGKRRSAGIFSKFLLTTTLLSTIAACSIKVRGHSDASDLTDAKSDMEMQKDAGKDVQTDVADMASDVRPDAQVPLERMWLKFNETSGDAIDSSGNGYTGFNNAITYESGLSSLGNCARFTAPNSYLTSVPVSINNMPTGSIAFWAEFETSGITDYNLLHKSATPGIRIQYSVANGTFLVTLNGSTISFVNNSFTADNSWHNHVFTFDGINVRYYRDTGLIDTQSKVSGVPDETTAADLAFIGSNNINNSERFNGRIDDFRVSNSVFTITQINFLFNSGAGTEEPLTE